jgi:hypothetical protein
MHPRWRRWPHTSCIPTANPVSLGLAEAVMVGRLPFQFIRDQSQGSLQLGIASLGSHLAQTGG